MASLSWPMAAVDRRRRPRRSPQRAGSSAPGHSVFQLRQLAYAEAAGEIVAITENHCLVPPDWGLRMLEAHRAHPEAIAVGGAVENAATRTRIDWASFFIVQVAVMPPLAEGNASRIAGAVNVSYKRRALEALHDFAGMGAMDVMHQQMLRDSGEALWASDAIRVRHDQSLGVAGTTAIHFHAGRTMSGFRRQRMRPTSGRGQAAPSWYHCCGWGGSSLSPCASGTHGSLRRACRGSPGSCTARRPGSSSATRSARATARARSSSAGQAPTASRGAAPAAARSASA